MPLINFKHIVSFSSEDPAFPADNLLKPDTYRKWQCLDANEKQASVVIELAKASKINSLDIGNNGSAFVEVLVGRSSGNDYQVLLVASSFMSPAESKSGTNDTRVRMFGLDKLSKSIAEQKWDRIKVVCTQPYNQTRSYGLSFVNLHTTENIEKDTTQEKTQIRLGSFLLKDEQPETIRSGSLFAKRKNKTEGITTPVITTAAEIKDTSKQTTTPRSSLSILKSTQQKSFDLKRKANSTSPEPQSKASKFLHTDRSGESSKNHKETVKNDKQKFSVDKILKEVVFVLSGFKNPQRGRLRDKALSMGARYCGDWGQTCTHLICAFINTPKYCQVKASGKGKIVSEKWINDCFCKRQRLPERRYRLKGDDDDYGSSTDEEDIEPKREKNSKKNIEKSANDVISLANAEVASYGRDSSETTNISSTKTSSVANEPNPRQNLKNIEIDSMQNTEIIEDEEFMKNSLPNDDDDLYNCSTECESDDEDDEKKATIECKTTDEKTSFPSPTVDYLNLPSFFTNMTFFLYGDFEAKERRLLYRYITAYNGELEEYMSDNVKFVVTKDEWDGNFNEALIENSSLTFVRPKWIYSCHEKRTIVPFQPYIVVPQ